jgi:hypothetical protein
MKKKTASDDHPAFPQQEEVRKRDKVHACSLIQVSDAILELIAYVSNHC